MIRMIIVLVRSRCMYWVAATAALLASSFRIPLDGRTNQVICRWSKKAVVVVVACRIALVERWTHPLVCRTAPSTV